MIAMFGGGHELRIPLPVPPRYDWFGPNLVPLHVPRTPEMRVRLLGQGKHGFSVVLTFEVDRFRSVPVEVSLDAIRTLTDLRQLGTYVLTEPKYLEVPRV